jgi:hypothetical protein
MITHIVFFRMQATDAASAEADAKELAQRLNALAGRIPSLRSIEAGVDFSATEASWNVGLISRFDDRKGLEAYRVHPAHQEVVKFVQQVSSERAVVDYAS